MYTWIWWHFFLSFFLCMWIFFLCLFVCSFVWHKSDVIYKKMLNHSFDISIYAWYILVVGGERISILLNYLFAMKCAVSCICVIEIICIMKSMSRTCCMSYYLLAWIKEYESISVLVFHHHCQSHSYIMNAVKSKSHWKKGNFRAYSILHICSIERFFSMHVKCCFWTSRFFTNRHIFLTND